MDGSMRKPFEVIELPQFDVLIKVLRVTVVSFKMCQ